MRGYVFLAYLLLSVFHDKQGNKIDMGMLHRHNGAVYGMNHA